MIIASMKNITVFNFQSSSEFKRIM